MRLHVTSSIPALLGPAKVRGPPSAAGGSMSRPPAPTATCLVATRSLPVRAERVAAAGGRQAPIQVTPYPVPQPSPATVMPVQP
jgi:hypothetical protein